MAPPHAIETEHYVGANDDAHAAQPVVAAWPHDSLEERLKRTS